MAGGKIRVIRKVLCIMAVAAIWAATSICYFFPNRYADEIKRAADEFNLPVPLVKSVVWAESRFNKDAVSKVGACGLMQIMPTTFEQIKAELKIDGNIFDVTTSLRCGCYYLSTLIAKLGEKGGLMAYNAGENNAIEFLNGATIFPETKVYLERIARAKKVYGIRG